MTGTTPHATACEEMRLLIQADQDGELDAAAAAVLAAHVQACPGCAALVDDLRGLTIAVRETLRVESAPDRLRGALAVQLAPAPPARPQWRLPRLSLGFAGGLAGGLAVAAMLLALLPAGGSGQSMRGELISGHIRALQPGHLIDVASSDRHSVKPWFAGKLDFAPPVADFAAAGFVLEGGRLDVIGGRSVAVLVYRRDRHPIDLFIWPAAGGADSAGGRDGYALRSWHRDGLAFHAVSDLDDAELAVFARLWTAVR